MNPTSEMGTSRNGLLIHSVIPLGQKDQIRQLWYIRYIPQFAMVYQLCTTARAFDVVHAKWYIYIYVYNRIKLFSNGFSKLTSPTLVWRAECSLWIKRTSTISSDRRHVSHANRHLCIFRTMEEQRGSIVLAMKVILIFSLVASLKNRNVHSIQYYV